MSLRIVLSWVLAVMACVLATGCVGGRGGGGPATRIEGNVRGAGGTVPTLAHVRIVDPATQEAVDEAEVRKDGSFVLKTRRSGLAWLELTAVDHAQLRIPTLLDGKTIAFDAKLGTYAPGDPKEPVQVIAWAGDPDKSEPMIAAMHPTKDGGYAVDLPAKGGAQWVQLGNLAGGGRSVNPPRAAKYRYDGAGDYRGLIDAAGGKLRVTVAAGELPTGAKPQIVFAAPTSTAAQLATLAEHWPGESAAKPGQAEALWERSKTSDDPLVRRVAAAMAITIDERESAALPQEDRALAVSVLESTPVGDSLWALMPFGLARAVELSGDPSHRAQLDRALAEQLGPEAGGMVLLSLLAEAHELHEDARARELYARLQKAPYAELGLGQLATAWNPDRKLKAGAPLPSFEAAALGQGKVRSADLRGKLVLIELWATWCQPCVAGMDELHALHREFATAREGAPRFEILSISMDEAPADVTEFRERWPMPWLHIFAGEDREKMYATFETASLPYSVLVDEHGKILEESAALEPGKLRGWLEKHAAAAAAAAAEPPAAASESPPAAE